MLVYSSGNGLSNNHDQFIYVQGEVYREEGTENIAGKETIGIN